MLSPWRQANSGRPTTARSGSMASRSRSREVQRVELPLVGHTFEAVHAMRLEVESRSGDEILDGPSGEDLATLGQGHHPSSDVCSDAGDVVSGAIDLTRVQARTDIDVQLVQVIAHCSRASQRSFRSVERGEEPVTGRLHHFT